MKHILLMVSVMMAVTGCQSTHGVVQSGRVSDTEFMNLWGVYRECRSSMDLETMRADVRQLNRGAQRTEPESELLIPLPESLKRLISKPPVRLSVDPGAMAVDCMLTTGHAALDAGRDEVALEMFGSILLEYPHKEYAYFVDQARLGLREVKLRAQAASQKPAAALTQAAAPRQNVKTSSVVSD